MHTAIWNETYKDFKSNCNESERTLPQVKKRQQHLEYDFTQLKLKESKTGEEGLNKIKESFPYYSIFDQTMGYRDSIDAAKMEIDSSSFIPSANPSNVDSTPQLISSMAKETNKSAQANGTDICSTFREMWEKSLKKMKGLKSQ